MDELFQWYNLIFGLMLAFGAIMVLMTAISGHGHDSDCHGHLHLGHAHDIHIGHHEIHIGGHHGHNHELHGHGNGDDTGFSKAMSILGIGRVPMVALMALNCLFFGTFGLCSNLIFQGMHLPAELFFWLSVGVSSFFSLIISGRIAYVWGKYMPGMETYGTVKGSLVTRTGRSVYKIDSHSGSVHAYDQFGTMHQIMARTAGETIEPNKEVLLEEYNSEGDFYIVSEFSSTNLEKI